MTPCEDVDGQSQSEAALGLESGWTLSLGTGQTLPLGKGQRVFGHGEDTVTGHSLPMSHYPGDRAKGSGTSHNDHRREMWPLTQEQVRSWPTGNWQESSGCQASQSC